jgi:hypothetical protein
MRAYFNRHPWHFAVLTGLAFGAALFASTRSISLGVLSVVGWSVAQGVARTVRGHDR